MCSLCHFVSSKQADLPERANVFDKNQLNKPYYTLLAVADRDELLTILHAVSEQSHLLSLSVPSARKAKNVIGTSKGQMSPLSQNTLNKTSGRKIFTPLTVDVSTKNTSNVTSLRARAIAAGCISCDTEPPPPPHSSSHLLVPSNRRNGPSGTEPPKGTSGLNCSPSMMALLTHLNPMHSLAEIRQELEIPLGEVRIFILFAIIV
jgi:hypothetical protein